MNSDPINVGCINTGDFLIVTNEVSVRIIASLSGTYWSSFNQVIYPGYIRFYLARVAYVTRLYNQGI